MKRWILLGMLACACGSDNGGTPDAGSGPGSVTGTVGGQALNVKDAVFGIDPLSKAAVLIVADRTGLCALLGGTTLPGTTIALGLVLVDFGVAGPVDHTTGDYAWIDPATPIPPFPAPGRYWFGSFLSVTSCTSSTSTDSTSGTVTVTQAGNSSGTHLKVTLTSPTFGTGNTLGGSIDATYCAAAINSSCGGSLRAQPPAGTE
jgi:hypothetical protein